MGAQVRPWASPNGGLAGMADGRAGGLAKRPQKTILRNPACYWILGFQGLPKSFWENLTAGLCPERDFKCISARIVKKYDRLGVTSAGVLASWSVRG